MTRTGCDNDGARSFCPLISPTRVKYGCLPATLLPQLRVSYRNHAVDGFNHAGHDPSQRQNHTERYLKMPSDWVFYLLQKAAVRINA